MRQKLFKIIVAVILVVSVFLCNSLVVLASEDDEEWPEVPGKFNGSITFGGSSGRMVACSGDAVYAPDSGDLYTDRYYSATYLLGFAVLDLQPGYSYDGYLRFSLSLPYHFSNTSGLTNSYFSASISDSSGSGWSSFGSSSYVSSMSGAVSLNAYVVLNNYSVSTGVNARFPIYVSISGMTRSRNADLSSVAIICDSPPFPGITNDLWEAAQVNDGSTAQYYIYEQTKLIEKNDKAAMEQQQQIADQQAEQSRQQHENLVNGYDNSSNNTMLEEKNQQLTDLEDLQNSAFDSANAGVMDYQSNYDVTPFVNLAPSFALIQVWFTLLWNGIGPFSPVLAVSLALCVAGYILKIKH